jgi:hypothetical protein
MTTGYRASWIILGKGPKLCNDSQGATIHSIPGQGISQALALLSHAVAGSNRRGDDMLLGALTSFGKDPLNQETLEILERIIAGQSPSSTKVKSA